MNIVYVEVLLFIKWYCCIKSKCYYYVRVFPSSGIFGDPCTSTMPPILFVSHTWENFTERHYNYAKGTAIFQ